MHSYTRRGFLKTATGLTLSAILAPHVKADPGGTCPPLDFQRLDSNPIITVDTGNVGNNVNGPSLIRVPDWVENPLGTYYLYFAHHAGTFIRMAYADDLNGPWTLYEPGTLQLEQTICLDHIASPDVHIDHERKQIRMYFHGTVDPALSDQDHLTQEFPVLYNQRTLVATSPDGLNFTAQSELLGSSYFRAFEWDGATYALGMPGIFYRSADGLTGFERGPTVFKPSMRHSAVMLCGSTLAVYYSVVGGTPEQIVCSTIELTPDWSTWTASEPVLVLTSETEYEGGELPVEPSKRGAIKKPAHQLRDPALFNENGEIYLLYSIAGESGLAMAQSIS